jgi:hypothetical protein
MTTAPAATSTATASTSSPPTSRGATTRTGSGANYGASLLPAHTPP